MVKEYQSKGYYPNVESNMKAIQDEYNAMKDKKDYQKAEESLAKDDWGRVQEDEDFKNAISAYTGDGFRKINGALRNGKDISPESGDTGKKIYAMDKVFNKSKLNRSLVVRRGVGDNSFKIFANMLGIEFKSVDQLREAVKQKMDKNKDICITDKGYMSTSLPFSETKFPAGGITGRNPGVEFVILVHKGTKAINVSPNSEFSKEKELLLNRGTKLRIVDAKMGADNNPICGATGPWTIYLETVPSAEEGIKREVA